MGIKPLLLKFVMAAAVLAAVTFLFRTLLPANPATVALTFLILVLLTSAFWGLRVSLFVSLSATAIFNFFFLPPIGTFTITDPHNWVALFAFLITAVVASNLSERARKQTDLAQQRREEVERLYELSQRLLTLDSPQKLYNSLPEQITQIFASAGCALIVSGKETIYRSRPDLEIDRELLLRVQARGEILEERNVVYVPLRIGVKSAGAMAIVGSGLSRGTMEAVGSLVGISAERARAMDELAHTRASQENEKLRSALLDSVAHEFKTPLTSIKASVTGLLAENVLDADQKRDLLAVIDEETDRLNRLVGEAAEMAQLDSQMFQLEKAPHDVKDVLEAALDHVHVAPEMHRIELHIQPDLPQLAFDFDRICEVITHLLENASKYSEKGTPICISAESTDAEIVISVADQGSGIDSIEQPLIFEKFYRGREQRVVTAGTGMGLAISKVIVEAHGGSISVVSQPGRGSVFSVHLPRTAAKSRKATG